MPVNVETLRLHLAYSAWASRTLVEAAALLSADQLTRDFHTSDRSVLGTLVHVFAADRVWFGRIEGNVPTAFLELEKDMHLEVLQTEWPTLQQRWAEWASEQTDASVLEALAYKDLKGNPYETELWKIVLHVVNHGTHHRGQVSGFIRTMGHTPPALDLIRYYRETG